MKFTPRILLVFVALSACTTTRVSTEFDELEKALASTDARVSSFLSERVEADREAEVVVSLTAGDPWFLSDGCGAVLDGEREASLVSCTVDYVPLGGREKSISTATAAQRKLKTLQSYVASLGVIMDATLEEEVTEAYATALTSFGELATVANSEGASEFISDRQESLNKTDAVVSAAIENLRYRRMRSVVLDSDEAFGNVVRELQLNLIYLEFDKDPEGRSLEEASQELRILNEQVLRADRTDTASYSQLVQQLRSDHRAFLEFYRGTVVYQLGLVGEVHSDLAAALGGVGEAEDVVNYLESLKELADTLEED